MKIKTSKTTVIDLRLVDIKKAVEHWMNSVHRTDVSKFQFDFHQLNGNEKSDEVVLTLSRTVYLSTDKETGGEKEYIEEEQVNEDLAQNSDTVEEMLRAKESRIMVGK